MRRGPERALTGRHGLTFTDPEVEAGYREWRGPHDLSRTRMALISGAVGSGTALVAVFLPPLAAIRPLGAPLLAFLVVVHIVGLGVTRRPFLSAVQPYSSFTNLVSGVGAVLLSEPGDSFTLTAAAVTFISYTGLALSRMPLPVAMATVATTVIFADVRGIVRFNNGEVSGGDLAAGLVIIAAAFGTALSIGIASELAARREFADNLIIEAQNVALFEERNNLARFLAPEVAQTIRERGLDATLRTEQVELTALCIDIRGFTAFTRHHGPETMAAVLGCYYETIVEASREAGATVKDFAGDGALILLGAPIKRPDHESAAFDLAVALRGGVGELLAPHSSEVTPLGVGVGLASGPCAVGAIGALSRLEYTAVGSAVNLSARLCARAQDGEIVMTAETAAKLPGKAEWRRDYLQLKGFDDAVETFADSGPVRL